MVEPPNPSIWQGRSDGPRLHQFVQCIDLSKTIPKESGKKRYGILGFCSDEGVDRNQGRVGASKGPASLRHSLANLPLHSEDFEIFDFGNIICENHNLEAAQKALGAIVSQLLRCGIQTFVLGGGHELAWGHFQGIHSVFSKAKISIINFDAHLDLREPLAGNLGTSGSSFYQIAQALQNRFEYTCIGALESANTSTLYERAKDLNATIIPASDIHAGTITLDDILEKTEKIYLSICLDIFAAPFAPGVSAPQPLGLYPWQVIPLIKQIVDTGKVIAVDIAELNPTYDPGQLTSKLAASLFFHLIK